MVSKEVENSFKERYDKALSIINASGIPYILLGIFGSYARGDYNATSDIDFVMIVNSLPERTLRSTLRDDLDELDCDITYLLNESYNNPWNEFTRKVKEDFKEIKNG